MQVEVGHEIEENEAEQERLQGFKLVYGEKIQVRQCFALPQAHLLQTQSAIVLV